MRIIVIITILYLINYTLKAQRIDIQVVYNNTAEVHSNAETINKIKTAVKIPELQKALNSNGHITDKNIKIRISFFNRGVIGQLKLKMEHELTPEGYIEKWQELVKNQSGVLFLFVKGKGENDYKFYKLVSSSQLEEEHLFSKVMEFINENLKGDVITIVGSGTKYLARAITPVWDVDLQDNRKIQEEAKKLAENEKYWENRINFFDNTWKSI